ncbi:recombinase family protein [Alkalihalobacillus pseudalcaliphilus]|uniref:recombinase family protein n=1 Tax=Alkalihalobacillus pseudalcaliphilus TaxID=79884 RepID=UPI00064E0040|nr:recombinase family protein [Alkalihalobacillus pseudalcaliphilus]KMK75272.1 hypothetical protein AB990_17795 [Alkalihalobacillus pseudalcaliphilus]
MIDGKIKDNIIQFFEEALIIDNVEQLLEYLRIFKKLQKRELSYVMKMILDPFYTGHEWYEGKYYLLSYVEPFISLSQFKEIQVKVKHLINHVETEIEERDSENIVQPFCKKCGQQMRYRKKELNLSTNREAQNDSLQNQKELFKQYAAEKGWNLVKVYEESLSGTKSKRPELDKLLDNLETDGVEIVLIKDVSRLARNQKLAHNFLEKLKLNSIHLVATNGQYDSREKSLDTFGLIAWAAELESQSTSDRIKSVKKLTAKKGKFIGSQPPFGYYKKDGRLFKRTDWTVDVVKRIYQDYLNGQGIDSIAKQLTLEVVPTPAMVVGKKNAGEYWRGSSIKIILMNEHYTDRLVQCRTSSISVTIKKMRHSEGVICENQHEPIISEEDFEAVQRMIKQRTRQPAKAKKHFFTNLIRCGKCDASMWFRREAYVCSTYAQYGKRKCSSHLEMRG